MHNPEGIYFVSFASINWIDIFVRPEYFSIIIVNLNPVDSLFTFAGSSSAYTLTKGYYGSGSGCYNFGRNDVTGTADFYHADVTSANDYYPFGMLMPERQFSSGDYRFGFNGKEQDSKVSGTGNQYDYGFRIYNPRIGKFLSVDPLSKSYPFWSPYQFAGNSPISGVDIDGLEYFFTADGVLMNKFGTSNEMMVLKTNSNYIELKNEGLHSLINGSYSISKATDLVYSNIATNIFVTTLYDKRVLLYNERISVNENNVPKEWFDLAQPLSDPAAGSYFFGGDIGGVINIKTKHSNYFDVINLMRHEQEHNRFTRFGKANNSYTHFDIYMNDFNHWSWEQTSPAYQNEHRSNALGYIGLMSEYTNAAYTQKGAESKLYKGYNNMLKKMINRYEERFNVKLEKAKGFDVYIDTNLENQVF